MAGDWIPIRHNLRDVEEVWGLAELTGLSRDMVVALLIRAWTLADAETTDGRFVHVKCAHLDAHVEHKGFAQAMIAAKWLEVDDANGGALVFPNFKDWMGPTAKKRLKHTKLTRQTRRERAQAVRETAHQTGTTETVTVTEKKTTSSCDKPVASKPKAPTSEFRQIVRALEEAVGKCATTPEHKRRSETVKQLLAAGATADEVRTRAERYRRSWPTMTLTDRALVVHWSKFRSDAKLGQAPLIEQED